MRITAGKLRGRKVAVPEFPDVRPTPAKVRQALFNILGSLEGVVVLELFSGSGLMAIEALSRGAVSVISVEKNRGIVSQLQKTRSLLGLEDDWQLLCGDVQSLLPRVSNQHFNLIFADPPYDAGFSTRIPAWLDEENISCNQLVIEEAACVEPIWPQGWTASQSRRYGETCLHFLEAESA